MRVKVQNCLLMQIIRMELSTKWQLNKN